MSVYITHMNLIAGAKLAKLIVLVSGRLGLNLAFVPYTDPHVSVWGRNRSTCVFPLRFHNVWVDLLMKMLVWCLTFVGDDLSLNFYSTEIESQHGTSFDCENH